MLNICYVFPIRKNLIRNFIETPNIKWKDLDTWLWSMSDLVNIFQRKCVNKVSINYLYWGFCCCQKCCFGVDMSQVKWCLFSHLLDKMHSLVCSTFKTGHLTLMHWDCFSRLFDEAFCCHTFLQFTGEAGCFNRWAIQFVKKMPKN